MSAKRHDLERLGQKNCGRGLGQLVGGFLLLSLTDLMAYALTIDPDIRFKRFSKPGRQTILIGLGLTRGVCHPLA